MGDLDPPFLLQEILSMLSQCRRRGVWKGTSQIRLVPETMPIESRNHYILHVRFRCGIPTYVRKRSTCRWNLNSVDAISHVSWCRAKVEYHTLHRPSQRGCDNYRQTPQLWTERPSGPRIRPCPVALASLSLHCDCAWRWEWPLVFLHHPRCCCWRSCWKIWCSYASRLEWTLRRL